MALCTQVVNLVRLGVLHDAYKAAGVCQVAVVQLETGVLNVRVLVNMVDALRVEGAGTAFDPMHAVPLAKQKLGKVRAVLAGDAGYERYFMVHQVVVKASELEPSRVII